MYIFIWALSHLQAFNESLWWKFNKPSLDLSSLIKHVYIVKRKGNGVAQT